MKIVAIETSTEYCSVALWQDGVMSERCELVGQKHSEVLMAMVDALLRESGLRIRDLDGIGFGKGPGSFTGVRIACGVAQGLAFGAGLNVVGVNTLEALAQEAGHDRVIAALDARMGEIYFAAYQKSAEGWSAVVEPCLGKVADIPLPAGRDWFGAGSGFALDGGALPGRYAGSLSAVDAGMVPQARAVAQLAAVAFAAGRAVDAAQAQPLYLRDKVALKTSER